MNKQSGFSLIMAIFILVILGLLGGYMVRLSGVQHATSVYTIQGTRAYLSAKGGIEWAVSRITTAADSAALAAKVSGASANDITSAGVVAGALVCSNLASALPLSLPGINGFLVSLTCSNQQFSNDIEIPVIYTVTSSSEYGVYSNTDYVSRKTEVLWVWTAN
jgi:MSHA biogenesis protein MshP